MSRPPGRRSNHDEPGDVAGVAAHQDRALQSGDNESGAGNGNEGDREDEHRAQVHERDGAALKRLHQRSDTENAENVEQVAAKDEANLAENLQALERSLKDGSFNPFPLRRKFIPKEPGQFRPLGIPAVRDRVVPEVVRRLLHPIFERLFHDASFGFRPKRNCHQALEQVLQLHDEGWQLHSHGFRFVRYADDFVVLFKSS